jgi:rubredoxin
MANDYDNWCCPNCGWETDQGYVDNPDYPGVFLGIKKISYPSSSEFPMSAVDWIELWKCPKCHTKFEVSNSNY